MQGRRRRRGIVIAICGLALAFALLFFGLDWLEKQSLKPEARGDLSARYADETVTINGKSYRKRPNLTTILLLGIDRPARNSDEPDDYHSGGNADFLRLGGGYRIPIGAGVRLKFLGAIQGSICTPSPYDEYDKIFVDDSHLEYSYRSSLAICLGMALEW